MSADGGLPDEMGRLSIPRRRRGTPPALDDDSLARLLDGRLAPADAPPGYAGVATVLAAAAGPARPDELTGEASARAAFARAVALSGPTPRRTPMLRKLPVRLAVLATAGLLVGGVAAALASESGNDQHRAATTEVTNTADTNDSTPPSTGAQGPDATGSAKFGLCNAYFSGQGGDHGNKNDSTAFHALAAAAASSPGTSDTERITAFCADVLAAKGGSDHANNGDNGTEGDDHGASQRDQHASGNDNGKSNAPHGRP